MKKRASTRIWALFIAALLIIGLIPTPIFANESESGYSISHFVPLADSIARQSVPLGTSAQQLNLPANLTAVFVSGDSGDSDADGGDSGDSGAEDGDESAGEPSGSELPDGEDTGETPDISETPEPTEPGAEDTSEEDGDASPQNEGEDNHAPAAEDSGSDSAPSSQDDTSPADGLLHSLALPGSEQIDLTEGQALDAGQEPTVHQGDDEEAGSSETPSSVYIEYQVSVVDWVPQPAYDPYTPGVYQFTPVLAVNWSYDPAILPVITVVVGDAEEPEEIDGTSGSASRTIQLHKPADSLRLLDHTDDPAGDSLHSEARDLYDILADLEAGSRSATPIPVRSDTVPPTTLKKDYTDLQLDAVIDLIAEDILQDEIAQPAVEAFWADNPSAPLLDEKVDVELDYTITYNADTDDYTLEIERVTFLMAAVNADAFTWSHIAVTYQGNPYDILIPAPENDFQQLAEIVTHLNQLYASSEISPADVGDLIITITQPPNGTAPVGAINFPGTIVNGTGSNVTFTMGDVNAPFKLQDVTVAKNDGSDTSRKTFSHPLSIAGNVTFQNPLILNGGLTFTGSSDPTLTVDCSDTQLVVQVGNIVVDSTNATLVYRGTDARPLLTSLSNGGTIHVGGSGVLRLDIDGHLPDGYKSDANDRIQIINSGEIDAVSERRVVPVGNFGNLSTLVYDSPNGYFIGEQPPILLSWADNGTTEYRDFDALAAAFLFINDEVPAAATEITMQLNDDIGHSDSLGTGSTRALTITSSSGSIHRLSSTSGLSFDRNVTFRNVDIEVSTISFRNEVILSGEVTFEANTFDPTTGMGGTPSISLPEDSTSREPVKIIIQNASPSLPTVAIGKNRQLIVEPSGSGGVSSAHPITLAEGAGFSTTAAFRSTAAADARLTIGNGATFEAASVTAGNKMEVNGGTISAESVVIGGELEIGVDGAVFAYTGSDLNTDANYAITFEDGATATRNGDLTVSAQGSRLINGATIIKSNAIVTDALLDCTQLEGAPFDGYILTYSSDTLEYRIANIVAVVTHADDSVGVPYGTFTAAVAAANALGAQNKVGITITTYKPTDEMPDSDGAGYLNTAPPGTAVTVKAANDTARDFRWSLSAAVAHDLTFDGIDLTVDQDISVSGNATLSLLNGATLVGKAGEIIGLAGSPTASLVVRGSSATVDTASGFGSVLLSEGAELTLRRIAGFGTLATDGASSLLLSAAANSGDGNIDLGSDGRLAFIGGATAFRLGTVGSYVPDAQSQIIRYNVGNTHVGSNLPKIELLGSFPSDSFLYALPVSGGETYGFYYLTRRVADVKIELVQIPDGQTFDRLTYQSDGYPVASADTITYGGTIAVAATLLDGSGNTLLNRDDQTLSIQAGTRLLCEHLDIEEGIAFLMVDEDYLRGENLERLAVTAANAPHQIAATFDDSMEPLEEAVVSATPARVTVEPIELIITLNTNLNYSAANPLTIIADKVYNGERDANLKLGTTFVHLLEFDTSVVLQDWNGVPEVVSISTGTILFHDDADASTNKPIEITEVELAGTHRGNYIPVLTGLPSPIQTTAEIQQRPVALVGFFEKTYDGTTTITDTSTIALRQADLVGGDDVTLAGANFAFNNADAGATVGVELISASALTGSQAHNYRLSTDVGDIVGSIHPVALSGESIETFQLDGVEITPASPLEKDYDGGSSVLDSDKITAVLKSDALPAGDANRGQVSIAVSGAQYADYNAGDDRPVTATLSIEQYVNSNGGHNYTWSSSALPTASLDGKINKLQVSNTAAITVTIPQINPARPTQIALPPLIYKLADNSVPPGSAGTLENSTWAWNPTNPDSSCIGGEPALINGVLTFTPEVDGDGVIIGGDITGTVTISSDNYEDVLVTIIFTVDEGKEGVEIDFDLAAEDAVKVYDGDPFDDSVISPTFEANGVSVPLQDEDWTISYTDAQGNAVSAPVDAGRYQLWITVATDDYSGTASTAITIEKRPLTIQPVDQEIYLGDAIPGWTDLANDFEESPQQTGDPDKGVGLVPGEQIFTINLQPRDKLAVAIAYNTGDPAGTYDVTLVMPQPEGGYTAPNYTLDYGVGTLTVKEIVADDSWITFSGNQHNGWYTTNISAQVNHGDIPSQYHYIGVSYDTDSDGNPVAPAFSAFELNQLELDLETDKTTEAYLFLANSAGDLSTPLTFAYKMDKTKPLIDGYTLEQPLNIPVALLRIDAGDEHSGIEKVTLEIPAGGPVAGPIEVYSMIDGRYEFNIPMEFPTGTYVVYATDRAGHESDRVSIVIDPPDLIKIVDEVTVLYNGSDVTDHTRELFLPDEETLTLSAAVGPGTTASFGDEYTFLWSSDNTAVASVQPSGDSSQAVVTLHTIGTANITVSALDKSATTTFQVGWQEEIPGGSDPYVVTIRILDLTQDRRVIETMQALIKQSSDKRIASFLENGFTSSTPWTSQTQWMDISIRHESGKIPILPLNKPIQVFLPYPDGVGNSSSSSYMLLHQRSSSSLVPLAFTRGEKDGQKGIFFYESNFSPFSLTWKSSGSGGDGGGDNSGGGTGYTSTQSSKGGSGTTGRKYYYDFFWEQVRVAIKNSEPGETIYVNTPADMTLIPTSVLQDLYGKDINLYITWQGEDIFVNGMDLFEPDPFTLVYLLQELADLYGISVLRPSGVPDLDFALPENPATGGDGDLVILHADGTVSPALSVIQQPILVDESGRLVTSSLMMNPFDPYGVMSGAARPVGFLLVLLPCLILSMLVHMLITRRGNFAAAPALALAGMGGSVAQPEPAALYTEIPVPAIVPKPKKPVEPPIPTAAAFEAWILGADEKTYFRLMGQQKHLAALMQEGTLTKQEYDRQILMLMHAQSSSVAELHEQALPAADTLTGIVAAHKALKRQYRNGEISREAYERLKKQLVMRS